MQRRQSRRTDGTTSTTTGLYDIIIHSYALVRSRKIIITTIICYYNVRVYYYIHSGACIIIIENHYYYYWVPLRAQRVCMYSYVHAGIATRSIPELNKRSLPPPPLPPSICYFFLIFFILFSYRPSSQALARVYPVDGENKRNGEI